jgi:hypothetical protein
VQRLLALIPPLLQVLVVKLPPCPNTRSATVSVLVAVAVGVGVSVGVAVQTPVPVRDHCKEDGLSASACR